MPMSAPGEQLAERLALVLDGGAVGDLRRLSGGASKETWAFTADGRDLVLQRQRASALERTGVGPDGEAALLEVAARAGMAVPRVVASSATADELGAPFLLMESVPGETIARRILRDDRFAHARARVVPQCAEALARLHSLPADSVDGLSETDPLGSLRDVVDLIGQPRPALELGFRSLTRTRPAVTGRTMVHGDFRLGNLIIDESGLAAVIDWELAHVGDPAEDLGWLCVRAWRFGATAPVAGLGQYAELLDAYASAGGREVTPETLRWWEAYGTLRWGVICLMQAAGHLSGMVRSHELATIGRRVCQTEHDLLGLLPGPVRPPLPAPEPVAWPGSLHGRPTAPELVGAVREWLAGDLHEGTDGRLRFHARVAANALAMVERELALGPAQAEAHAARLRDLGAADDAELAAAIRAGDLDDRWDEVKTAVWADVLDALAVADPGYSD